MATAQPSSTATFGSFLNSLKPIIRTPQFLWFLGHVSTVCNTTLYLAFSFFSYNTSKKYYNYSLLSIILTYSIVLFQVFKSSKTISFFNFRTFKNNDNFQYLLIAVTWYFASNVKVISGGLYPFIIFSAFHVMNYFKNFLLPILPSVSPSLKNSLASAINNIITNFNEQSLVLASNLEFLILIQLIIGLPVTFYYIFKNQKLAAINIFIILEYVAFLKLRYRQSKYTKLIVDGSIYKADAFILGSGRVPVVIGQKYQSLKAKVSRFIGFIPV